MGRRVRRLDPQVVDIAAPRARVFALVAAPYAARTSRAIQQKVRVLERGSDLWALGERWGDIVAPAWERTVARSLDAVKAEAERAHR